MGKIFSGHYYGTHGTETQLAGTGLTLGKERTGATLTSGAYVFGGAGYQPHPGSGRAGGDGGIGVAIASGTLTNYATNLYGGTGGSANGPGNAGNGGIGVSFASEGVLRNHALISGGIGGFGSTLANGGDGGVGVDLAGGGQVINYGVIKGGVGKLDFKSTGDGAGGTGLVLAGAGFVLNIGTIEGGSSQGGDGDGGDALIAANAKIINAGEIVGGEGSLGGIGVRLGAGGVLDNTGTISGGTSSYERGSGGVGVILDGGTRPDVNAGLIIGGEGRAARFGMPVYGGIGLEMETAGTLVNSGTIAGGAGMSALGPYVAPAVELGSGSTLINSGKIISESDGVAILLGDSGSSRLILDPGSSIEGGVVAGGTDNVLEFAAGGSFGAMYLAQFHDLNTLQLDSQSTGTLSGLTTQYDTGTLIDLQFHSDWSLSGSTNVIDNAGTAVVASGASLDVVDVDPSSYGTFALTGKSSLEIGQLLGSKTQIEFLGTSAGDLLTIDHPADFGLNLGSPDFAGPLLEDFQAGDRIDLKGIGYAGLKTNYNATTGVLQITASSAGVVASLQFQTASLGAGSFHLSSDDAGGSLLKLS